MSLSSSTNNSLKPSAALDLDFTFAFPRADVPVDFVALLVFLLLVAADLAVAVLPVVPDFVAVFISFGVYSFIVLSNFSVWLARHLIGSLCFLVRFALPLPGHVKNQQIQFYFGQISIRWKKQNQPDSLNPRQP